MSKKHYQILADAIKRATDLGDPNLIHKDQLITLLAGKLKEDNPNFDGYRFAEACSS